MPEHEEVTPEEIAAIGEQYFMTQFARRKLRDSNVPDLRTMGVGIGTGVLSLGARAVGADETADRLNRFSGAYHTAQSELDREAWESGQNIVPPIVRGAVRGAGEVLPGMIVAGAAGGPYAAIGLAAGQEANQAITTGREAGLKGTDLAAFVGSKGTVEAVPAIVMQKVGLGGLEKIVGQKGAQEAGKGMIAGLKQLGFDTLMEVPEELITEIGHANVEAKWVDPGATEPKRLFERGLATVLQTGVMMGAAGSPQVVQSAFNPQGKLATESQAFQSAMDRFRAGEAPSRKEAEALGMRHADGLVRGPKRRQWFQDTFFEEVQDAGTAVADVPSGSQRELVETADPNAAGQLEPGTGGVVGPEGPSFPASQTGIPEPTADAGQPAGQPLNRKQRIAARAQELESFPTDELRSMVDGATGVDREALASIFKARGLSSRGETTSQKNVREIGEQRQQAERDEAREQQASRQFDEADTYLRERGWELEHASESGSRYYTKHGERLRVADHDVPHTAERNDAAFSWADSVNGVVLPVDDLQTSLRDLVDEPVEATETPVEPTEAPESSMAPETREETPQEPDPAVAAIADALPTGDPGLTSIKNRIVDELQAEMGRDPIERSPRESFDEWDQDAAQKMAEDPTWVPGLIDEFRRKARPHTKVEAAGLSRYQRAVKNRLNAITGRMSQAFAEGDSATVAQLQTEALTAEDQMQTLHEASTWAGSETGRGLAARKMERRDDFSLAELVTRKMRDKGGEAITPEELIELKEQADRVSGLKAQLEQKEEELARERARKRVDETLATVPETLDDRTAKQWKRPDLVKRAEGLGLLTKNRKREQLIGLINEVEGAIREEAERNEIPYPVFAEAVRQALPDAQDYASQRRRAKEIATKATKLTPAKIRDLENDYKDHSSVLEYDTVLQELQSDPDVGPFLNDSWDAADDLWQLLREPEIDAVIRASSPHVLQRAAELVERGEVTAETLPPPEAQAQFVGETPRTPAQRESTTAPKPEKEVRRQRKAQAVEAFKEKWARLGQVGFAHDPQQQAELQLDVIQAGIEVVKAYVADGYATFAEFWSDFRANTDGSTKAKQVFQQAWQQTRDEGLIQSPEVDLENPESISRLAHRIERAVVEGGVRGRDAVVDAVHTELAPIVEGITRRETMDALSMYGQFSELSNDEIDVLIREYHGELQQIAKLEDMAAGKPPAMTGQERRTRSAAERELITLVNEAKKRNPHLFTDENNRRLKGAEEAAKARLRNRIEDVERLVTEKRERAIKERTDIDKDDEYKRLRNELDYWNDAYAKMFPPKGASDAKRAEASTKSMLRAAEKIQARLKAGDIGPKGKMHNRPFTKEQAAAKEQLEAWQHVVQELRDIDNPKMSKEERDRATYKTILQNRLTDYRARIKAGDFAPRKRAKKEYDDPAITDLQYELEEAKKEIRDGWEKERFKRFSAPRKVWNYALRSSHAVRSVWTSFDVSGFGRQGGAVVAAHPILAAKTLVPTFEAIRKKGLHRSQKALEKHDKYAMAKKAGLALTSVDGPVSQQEEPFIGTIAQEWVPGVAMSERMYVAGLNQMRMDLFDAMTETLGRFGKVTDAEAEVIAEYVNIATGRGTLIGPLQTAGEALAATFFSPRYVASRFQLLTLYPLMKGNLRTKLLIGAEYGRMALSLALFYGLVELAKLFWPDDDERNKPKTNWDWLSSDFGKVKMGNTRIDPLFGLSQTMVVLGRTATGTKTTQRGKRVPLRSQVIPWVTRKRKMEFGSDKTSSILGRFLRSKAAPVPGLLVNLLDDETVVGEKYTEKDAFGYRGDSLMEELFTPLAFRDVVKVMEDQGVPKGSALWIASLFGMGMQVYEPQRRKRKK